MSFNPRSVSDFDDYLQSYVAAGEDFLEEVTNVGDHLPTIGYRSIGDRPRFIFEHAICFKSNAVHFLNADLP